MSYTKGPWIASEIDDFGKELIITTNDRFHMDYVPICEMDIHFDGHIGYEQKANAVLISKCPNMLEALREIVEVFKNTKGMYFSQNEAIRKAIQLVDDIEDDM